MQNKTTIRSKRHKHIDEHSKTFTYIMFVRCERSCLRERLQQEIVTATACECAFGVDPA